MAATRDGGQTAVTQRVVPIELRVLFDRGGDYRVTLLPRRRGGLPDECTVSTANGGALDLVALEDEWYQDVTPDDLGSLLGTGVLWTHEETGYEWVLAGREIFVLAAGTTHRGFVSRPRLTLGHEQAVLCTTSNVAAVEGALQEAGCAKWVKFGEEYGAPLGWILVADSDPTGRPRGFVPTKPVRLAEGSDILNVLRPLPEIDISLEGGVPLGYSSWLAGYPPTIRILGDAQHAHKVLIDGNEATIGQDGVCRAPGWDEPGSHQIWCSNLNRRYSLIRLQRTWDAWPAYTFESSSGGDKRVAICGPLVRQFTIGKALGEVSSRLDGEDSVRSNPILLGAVPGQIFVVVPRRDIRGAHCFPSPSFDPVWALPAQPLQFDKTAHRILLVGDVKAPGSGGADRKTNARAVLRWCGLILDASRKGLAVEPAAARDLWLSYKQFARSLRRRTR
jgi:hypothetical protein